jgi:hypothetical protein
LDDYEFEVLYDSEKGLWTADLFNGNYLINVKAPGYAEVNQYVEVRAGKRSFRINCTPKAQSTKQLKIFAINIQTGRPVSSVFMQLHKSKS